MGVCAKIYSDEEMEDFVLGKLARQALKVKEERPVEEIFDYLRKQGVDARQGCSVKEVFILTNLVKIQRVSV
jgi:hypothetical protein